MTSALTTLKMHRLLAHGFCSCSQWGSEESSRAKIRDGHEEHLTEVLYAQGFRSLNEMASIRAEERQRVVDAIRSEDWFDIGTEYERGDHDGKLRVVDLIEAMGTP